MACVYINIDDTQRPNRFYTRYKEKIIYTQFDIFLSLRFARGMAQEEEAREYE